MSLFLFLKPIVDMLYQWQLLDYAMVVLALVLLSYQLLLVRPSIRTRISFTDIFILLIAILMTVTFIRSGEGYTVYFKVLSGLLMYFLGRIYYDRVLECTDALVASSYVVILTSVVARLLLRGRSLYYSDTDMAIGMIMALVCIAMFGKNRWYKAVTVLLVCPLMVFLSYAGTQKVLLIVIMLILLIFIWEWISESKKLSNILLLLLTFGLLGAIAWIFVPLFFKLNNSGLSILKNTPLAVMISSDNMLHRLTNWQIAADEIYEASQVEQLFGIGMGMRYDIGSLYVKTVYSLGITGLILLLLVVLSIVYHAFRVEDRKTYYATMVMTILFLGTGVTLNSMETVQVSWLPLLFSGMTISSVQVARSRAIDAHRIEYLEDERGRMYMKRSFFLLDAIGMCPTTREDFVREVFEAPRYPVSATVNLVGVPAVVSVKEKPALESVYNGATINTLDGMPFVLKARRLGYECDRCSGPDMMGMIFAQGIDRGTTHYFYGGKNDEVLNKLKMNLEVKYPGIQIVGMYSPPFRPLTDEENSFVINEINTLKPDFVWVGIGAPKQEIWMHEHRDEITGTCMLGVGAAFDFLAGTLAKAPEWIENAGFEWLFRLLREPKRLWRRYIVGGIKYGWYSFLNIFDRRNRKQHD